MSIKERHQAKVGRKAPNTFNTSSDNSLKLPITSSVIRRARFDPVSLTSKEVLQLRPFIGNKTTGQLIARLRQARTSPVLPIFPSQKEAVQTQKASPATKAGLSIQRALTDHTDYDDDHVDTLLDANAKRQYIRNKLDSAAIQDAIDDLYFEAYEELMDKANKGVIGSVWKTRFFLFETRRSEWQELMKANDFDVTAARAKWNQLRLAYNDVENRLETLIGGGVQFSQEATNVYDDMKDQFRRWNGTLARRGAWWGSAGPGITQGAANVPQNVIQELRQLTTGTNWRFTNSTSGGVSFHRTRGSIDFIYHMQSPAN